MRVDVLDAFFASAVLYGVGRFLFWVNKTMITLTADAVFGHFKKQGAQDFEPPPMLVIDDVEKKSD